MRFFFVCAHILFGAHKSSVVSERGEHTFDIMFMGRRRERVANDERTAKRRREVRRSTTCKLDYTRLCREHYVVYTSSVCIGDDHFVCSFPFFCSPVRYMLIFGSSFESVTFALACSIFCMPQWMHTYIFLCTICIVQQTNCLANFIPN